MTIWTNRISMNACPAETGYGDAEYKAWSKAATSAQVCCLIRIPTRAMKHLHAWGIRVSLLARKTRRGDWQYQLLSAHFQTLRSQIHGWNPAIGTSRTCITGITTGEPSCHYCRSWSPQSQGEPWQSLLTVASYADASRACGALPGIFATPSANCLNVPS